MYNLLVMTTFPIDRIRHSFPALRQSDGFLFFDNAAGAQIPQNVLDAVNEHLVLRNVQRGGRYEKSRAVDAAIEQARAAVAAFLNARSPEEIAFGMNATSFLRLVSLALAESLGERREIVVTDLDHEANVAVWLALERQGAAIRWWRFREDGRLHAEDLAPLLSSKTRLVACTAASNALGSIVDVAAASRLAHAAGAELLLDAVHYAPHGPIDVQAWDCDYLICSGYKIFAPHMGFLWGRSESLAALCTFREDFIPDAAPAKIEVGTYVYENVAGMSAAIDYLESLAGPDGGSPAADSRRGRLVRAMERIRDYEATLSAELLRGLAAIDGVTIYGLRDPASTRERVPTLSFNVAGIPAAEVCAQLAARGIGVRDGNMYAPRVISRLGLGERGSIVRASLVHYNTREEIATFLASLAEIADGGAAPAAANG
jgi:cysteine desulfurase family protein (TIGR01976 family)